jgi:translation initiation factor IF-2
MSIRIHELAKRYNMEGRDMLTLLKDRGYVAADTKSVSSTVSKIYVEEIDKEFAAKAAASTAAAGSAATAVETVAPPAPPPVEAAAPAPVETAPPEAPKSRVPVGIFVKTAEDIARTREAAAKAASAYRTAPLMPPRPVAAVRPSPPLPLPGLTPPPPRPAVPAPAPAPLRPSAPAPVPTVVSAPPVPPVTPVGGPAPAAKPLTGPPALPPRAAPAPRPPGATAPVAPPALVVTIEDGVKIIHLKPPVIVRDFAVALGLKPFKLISELNQIVGFASMNSTIDEAVAQKVAEKYGFLLDIKHRGDVAQQQAQKDKVKLAQPVEDEEKNLVPRPPVACILGHVDHGKTSLLDAIRKANVAAGEAGGITQHIGAYQVEFNGRKITFLDTPGHAAFTKMRSRGANGADVAILVVAADDGFMPQTDEALKIALAVREQHAEKVALIVAVNKMDVKGANLDQVKAQMQQRGIAPEDWGGETITVPVSALKGTGINELLEMILLQADVLELKANPKAEAVGVVIESQVDVGRGPVATVIVQRGTLRIGDAIVCGPHWAKVRAMFDDQARPLKEAPPSTPVRVVGWSGTPESGATFKAVKNAREAENLAEEEDHRLKQVTTVAAAVPKDISVESLFANIAATQQKALKVILKTDVFGSAEAVRQVLEGIKSTKVALEIVSADVGLVTKNDVIMAGAAGATVLGFNTKLENGVTPLAKHHGVRIESFAIIYELGDKVREMMADLLDPDIKEIKLGAAEVRATFPLAKGFVAGCLVTEGKINRGAAARLRRGREIVHQGKVATLKRFKDDANEVRAGLECGIKLDDFNGYQAGDVIECYDTQKVRASL